MKRIGLSIVLFSLATAATAANREKLLQACRKNCGDCLAALDAETQYTPLEITPPEVRAAGVPADAKVAYLGGAAAGTVYKIDPSQDAPYSLKLFNDLVPGVHQFDDAKKVFAELKNNPVAFEGDFRIVGFKEAIEDPRALKLEYVKGVLLDDILSERLLKNGKREKKLFELYCSEVRKFGKRMQSQGWTFTENKNLDEDQVPFPYPQFIFQKGDAEFYAHPTNVIIDPETLKMVLIDFE